MREVKACTVFWKKKREKLAQLKLLNIAPCAHHRARKVFDRFRLAIFFNLH